MLKRKLTVILVLFIAATGANAHGSATKVFVKDLITNKASIKQPSGASRGNEWELTVKEQNGIRNLFAKSLEKSLEERKDLIMVKEESNADYIVSAKLVRLSPTAPKDTFHDRQPMAVYVTRGAGSITIEFTIANQGMAKVVKLHQVIGQHWGVNDRFTNQMQTTRVFKRLAKQLTEEIESTET